MFKRIIENNPIKLLKAIRLILLKYKEYGENTLIARVSESNSLNVGEIIYLNIDSKKIMLIDK